MDSRSTRSRSKTPFNPVELTSGFIENESHTENVNRRITRRTTTFRTKETSSGEVSSMIERPVRKSARSERTSQWYKTSDYSSEDGENEVSSTRTITQNEKNQLVEDARAAANGNNEVSALNLYKKSGRYWDVYPKTDWTYSPHSKDRTELAPGVVAMPNMSRKTIHSVHSSEETFDFAHKETNTEVDYLRRQLFRNNNNDDYKSRERAGLLRRQWRHVSRVSTSIFTTVVTIFQSLFWMQTSWFAKLHTFASRVMLLDTWLLWKNRTVNKTARLAALCLVPLILLGGCCLLTNLGSILKGAYYNSTWASAQNTENIINQYIPSVPLPEVEEKIAFENAGPIAESKIGMVHDETRIVSPSAGEIASQLSDEQLNIISRTVRENYNVDDMVEYIVKSPSFQTIVHKFQGETLNVDNDNLLKHQQAVINNLQVEIDKLKQDMQEIEKSRKEDINRVVSQLQADNVQNTARLNYNLNRCCRKSVIDVEAYVKRTLTNLLSDTDFIRNQKGLSDYLHTIHAAKQDLENQLLNLTSHLDSKYANLIQNNSLGLMDKVSKNIKLEISKQLKTEAKADYHVNESGVPTISEEGVRKIVRNVLAVYDADKTGLVDYAMETMGGQILTTRCTENYHYGKAVVSVLGIPLWYPVNSPRTIITPSINPGQCWAFQNFPGFAAIRLSKRIKVEAFSLEHISKLLVPNGEIDSAPKMFEVYGLTEENDKDPVKLGEYVYDYDGEPLQFFEVQNAGHTFEIVELRVLSNWGNPNYTCLYRFRVHGSSVL